MTEPHLIADKLWQAQTVQGEAPTPACVIRTKDGRLHFGFAVRFRECKQLNVHSVPCALALLDDPTQSVEAVWTTHRLCGLCRQILVERCPEAACYTRIGGTHTRPVWLLPAAVHSSAWPPHSTATVLFGDGTTLRAHSFESTIGNAALSAAQVAVLRTLHQGRSLDDVRRIVDAHGNPLLFWEFALLGNARFQALEAV